MDFYAGMQGPDVDPGLSGFFSSIGHFFSNAVKAVGQAGHDVIKAASRSKAVYAVAPMIAPLVENPSKILPTAMTFATTTLATGNPIAGVLAAGVREFMGGNQILGGSTMAASAIGSAGFDAASMTGALPAGASSEQLYANPLLGASGKTPAGLLNYALQTGSALLGSSNAGAQAGQEVTAADNGGSSIPYVAGGGGYGIPADSGSSDTSTPADTGSAASVPSQTGGFSGAEVVMGIGGVFALLLFLNRAKTRTSSKAKA